MKMKKVCLWGGRNRAAILRALRGNSKTSSAAAGVCGDGDSPQRIGCALLLRSSS